MATRKQHKTEVRATAKARVPVLLRDASCVTSGRCSTSLKPCSPCHTGNSLPSRVSVFGKPRIRLPGLTYIDVLKECTVPGSGARCLRQHSSNTRENPSPPLAAAAIPGAPGLAAARLQSLPASSPGVLPVCPRPHGVCQPQAYRIRATLFQHNPILPNDICSNLISK